MSICRKYYLEACLICLSRPSKAYVFHCCVSSLYILLRFLYHFCLCFYGTRHKLIQVDDWLSWAENGEDALQSLWFGVAINYYWIEYKNTALKKYKCGYKPSKSTNTSYIYSMRYMRIYVGIPLCHPGRNDVLTGYVVTTFFTRLAMV